MSDPQKALQQLLGGGELKDALFPPTSRYHGIELAAIETADGRTIAFLRRRFVPAAENLDAQRAHVVESGDRLDNLSAKYLADPEAFWRLADANGAVRPDELTEEPGTRLRVPTGDTRI